MYTDSHEVYRDGDVGNSDGTSIDITNESLSTINTSTAAPTAGMPTGTPITSTTPLTTSSSQQNAKRRSYTASLAPTPTSSNSTITNSSTLVSPKQRKVHEALLSQGHTIESLRNIVNASSIYNNNISNNSSNTVNTANDDQFRLLPVPLNVEGTTSSVPPHTQQSTTGIDSTADDDIETAVTPNNTTNSSVESSGDDALLGTYEPSVSLNRRTSSNVGSSSSSARRVSGMMLPPRNSVRQRPSFTMQRSASRTNVSRNSYNNNNSTSMSLDRSDGSHRSTSSMASSGTGSSFSFNPWLMKGGLFANSTRRGKNQQQQSTNDSSVFDSSSMRSSVSSTSGLPNNSNIIVSQRRYKVGENVLIKPVSDPSSSTSYDTSLNQYVCFVNKYGFVPDDPRCQSDEEYFGPYQYVLASVQHVHFEEIHPYYMVQRYDLTGYRTNNNNSTKVQHQQRADYYQMEPILTQRHEMAALQAVSRTKVTIQEAITKGMIVITEDGQLRLNDNKTSSHQRMGNMSYRSNMEGDSQRDNSNVNYNKGYSSASLSCCDYILYLIEVPFYCIVDSTYYLWRYILVQGTNTCLYYLRKQANLCLYGREPYSCRMQLTMLNFVVMCSTWFLFMDQLRLAFFPPTADDVLAIISFVVWIVLLVELFCEVYIRPDGYQGLLVSDKAFAPTTIRYINTIHFVIELLALAAFVPEFFCLFTNYSCSERFPFSLFNAILIGVIGPTFQNVFYGHIYIAFVRIRIFCMVRHWKNMWVTRTFINMTWHSQKDKLLSNIIPPSVNRRLHHLSSNELHDVDDTKAKQIAKHNKSDSKLTNASNIGTALMVINSYRTLAIVCVVGGLFPIIFSSMTSIINPLSYEMTSQLQATNMVANDTSNETCSYLRQSIGNWLIAVNIRGGLYDAHLLTLQVEPSRCGYTNSTFTNVEACQLAAILPAQAVPVCMEWYSFANTNLTTAEIANAAQVRQGAIKEIELSNTGNLQSLNDDRSEYFMSNNTYSVITRFDNTLTIQLA
jgi:hypothetical protein